MNVPIISIVEGHGEVAALPLLLRRLVADVRPEYWVHAPYPIRVPRDKLLKPNQLERYFQLAAAQSAGGGVLIIMDSEDPHEGCPATLGPSIQARAALVRNDIPTLVVMSLKPGFSQLLSHCVARGGSDRTSIRQLIQRRFEARRNGFRIAWAQATGIPKPWINLP